jgi:hypothetical protein
MPSILRVPGLEIAFLLDLPPPALLLVAPRDRVTQLSEPTYEESPDI